jgi:tRNA-2-methylthio-N6-dimethylallyladenosine synthase
MAGQVPEAEKEARLARLQALLNAQKAAFNARQVGRTLPVLFERAGRQPGQVVGRSPYLQAVHCSGPASLIGQIEPMTITAAKANSLAAERRRQAA